MPELPQIVQYLDNLLQTHLFKDASLNGLQVEAKTSEFSKIAFAVDAGESIIAAATSQKAHLLVVHHGLFWSEPRAIVGPLARKVAQLLENGCSLYASHLPLDANVEAGNAFELGRALTVSNLTPFFQYQGRDIGAMGSAPVNSMEHWIAACKQVCQVSEVLSLPFGREQITKIGIVTGSGASAMAGASAHGLDLLISGEPKHEAYHLAKELKLNVIFAGHYATETFGVKALERLVSQQFAVKTFFIDESSGI